jgi:hypothetical protein
MLLPAGPAHKDRAKEAMVDRLVAAVEEDFDLVERSDKTYRRWK